MESRSPGDTLTLRRAEPDGEVRWRDLVSVAAAIVFETDSFGRFTFVGPESALGWSADTLIGRQSETLLPAFADSTGFNPFLPARAVQQLPTWVNRADGSTARLNISARPILDAAGQVLGAHGIGFDLSQHEPAMKPAGAQRRWEVLDHVLRHMRVEVLAPRMMQATLERLVRTTGAAGALVLDAQLLTDATGRSAVLHEHGSASEAVTSVAHAALSTGQPGAMSIEAASGEQIILCPSTTRFSGSCGLILWREPDGCKWDADDLTLIGAAANVIRIVLEHEAIQNEMAQQSRMDPVTGLPNRRTFLDEAHRRVERLDRAQVPVTIMLIDLDGFKQLNDRLGHDVGDAALVATADLLRQTFRPTDIIARMGADEFAVWLDGADTFSSAERAEELCRQAPQELNYMAGSVSPDDLIPMGMSIGLAMRWPEGEEDLDTLLRQAEEALRAVKRHGGRNWKVFQKDEPV
jgi:diguanylate cyclase (GGDEF)-like protein/PAS domain S-box-containing protein